jgi:hypothetical protein
MIERSSNGGTNWSAIVLNTGSTSTTYSDSGLSAGTTYTYRVSAINGIGTSSPSNTASATTSVTTSATALSINSIHNKPWGKTITVSGRLTDNNGAGIANKVISFSGTGAVNLPTAVTNATGFYSSSGASPNTVATGLTVQAHFVGDSQYLGSDSAVKTYNTLIHRTMFWSLNVPTSVTHGTTYTVDGKLKDTTTGTFLASRTVTFTATSPIVIPNAVTDSTGKYSASNLVAPSAGSYNIQAHFAGDSLYSSSDSVTKILNVT